MSTDWVPLLGYDANVVVPSVSQSDLPLFSTEFWSRQENVHGNIEDQTKSFKVLRIVGYWTVYANADPQNPQTPPADGGCWVRIWPGFQDQRTSTIAVAGPLTTMGVGNIDEVRRAANEKWWWERYRDSTDITGRESGNNVWADVTAYTHPWHVFTDIRPGYWCSEGMLPTVTIVNVTDEDLTFRHRWRMLVAF